MLGDTGRDQTRCEFGGLENSSTPSGVTHTMGWRIYPPSTFVTNREQPVDFAEGPVDGSPDYLENGDHSVLFASVSGVTVKRQRALGTNPFSNSLTTNEIDSARVVESGLTGDDAGTTGSGLLNAPVSPADDPSDQILV